jgi:hypothetical protein
MVLNFHLYCNLPNFVEKTVQCLKSTEIILKIVDFRDGHVNKVNAFQNV